MVVTLGAVELEAEKRRRNRFGHRLGIVLFAVEEIDGAFLFLGSGASDDEVARDFIPMSIRRENVAKILFPVRAAIAISGQEDFKGLGHVAGELRRGCECLDELLAFVGTAVPGK